MSANARVDCSMSGSLTVAAGEQQSAQREVRARRKEDTSLGSPCRPRWNAAEFCQMWLNASLASIQASLTEVALEWQRPEERKAQPQPAAPERLPQPRTLLLQVLQKCPWGPGP